MTARYTLRPVTSPTQRPFLDTDLHGLQEVLSSWILEAGDLGYCHPGDLPHRIYNGIRGRFDLGDVVKLYEVNSTIVGVVVVQPSRNGFDAFTSPRYRGSTLEANLIQQGYRITRQMLDAVGHVDQPAMADAHHRDSLRISALEASGFVRDSHTMNITEIDVLARQEEPRLPLGFTVQPAKRGDSVGLAKVHNGAFGSNWTPEKYQQEVMLKPGYQPGDELVITALNGEFAAFAKTWLDPINKVGLFQPVGVHADFHRKGLGKALMLYGLRHMEDQGMKTALVCHKTDNPASAALYQSIGFKTKHRVIDFARPRHSLYVSSQRD